MVLPNFCWANSDSDANEQNISRRKLDLFNPTYVNSRNNETEQQKLNEFKINDAQMENQENNEKELIKPKSIFHPSFISSNGYYGYSMIQNSNVTNNVDTLSTDNNMELENMNTIDTENFNEAKVNCIPTLNLRKRYCVSEDSIVNENDEDCSKYSKRRRCKFDSSHDFSMDLDEDDQMNNKYQEQSDNIIDSNEMQSGNESKLLINNSNSQNISNDISQQQHQQQEQNVHRDMSRCMTSHMI